MAPKAQPQPAAPKPLTPAEEAALAATVEATEGAFTETAAADLAVADTKAGKTTLIGTMALDIFRQTGKITRLYVYDSGGFGALVAALIAKGIIEVWRVKSRDPDGSLGLAVGTAHLACLGCWPLTRDPKSGISPEGVALIAPSCTFFEGFDAGGALRGTWRGQDQIPPEAKASLRIERVRRATPGFENVGGIGVDGFTSMSAYAMEDLNYRAARNELGGEKGNMNTVRSSGMEFGVAGRGGVGFIQNRARNWASALATIEGLVRPPLVTALKDRGEDNSMPIYGPKIEGRAQIAVIPSWFGNCYGLESIPTRDAQGKARVEYRLYLQPYALDDGVVNKVGNRGNDPTLPLYITDPEGATLENGQLYSVWGMHTVYKLLDQAVDKNAQRADAMLGGRKAPGLGDGKLPESSSVAAIGTASVTVGRPAARSGRPAPPPPPAGKVAQVKAEAPKVEVVTPAVGVVTTPPATAAAPVQPAPIQAEPPAPTAPTTPAPPAAPAPRPVGGPPVGGMAATKAPLGIPPQRKGPPPLPPPRRS